MRAVGPRFRIGRALAPFFTDGLIRQRIKCAMATTLAPTALAQQLAQWVGGAHESHREVIELTYATLHRIAARTLAGESGAHTLQTTALVHEAYLELSRRDSAWQDQRHFYATATLCMRHILVDHARRKQAGKRGGGQHIAHLDGDMELAARPEHELLELDQALDELSRLDERRAQTLALAYFGGLERKEIADTLGISLRTVDRELRLGEAWLAQALT